MQSTIPSNEPGPNRDYTDIDVTMSDVTATSAEENKPDRRSNEITVYEVMQRNRKERRRIGKLNGKKFPGITFPITKSKIN